MLYRRVIRAYRKMDLAIGGQNCRSHRHLRHLLMVGSLRLLALQQGAAVIRAVQVQTALPLVRCCLEDATRLRNLSHLAAWALSIARSIHALIVHVPSKRCLMSFVARVS